MSPSPGHALTARQLWGLPTTTSSITAHCTPFMLPADGVISLADSAITLTTDVVFQPACTGMPADGPGNHPNSVADLKDPFYASTTPQTYVIAAATVIAWILVFMLIITPRTTFFGTPVNGAGFNSGHGIIGGANGGGGSLIGVGSRPWLQKVAALTVAVSLTIATADTFEALEKQYDNGYMDATAMREEVMGSLEIRITRVISDVFLWLAQVQTLIRLFPRHKEKVLIKWIGFALILCDSTFSCLNSFMATSTTTTKPRHFVDAIPALSYLFELALGLLYAAWVIYYAMTKRRYAFYHNKMKSISLIALLSLVAVLTPVVFFVTDVSNSDIAGWGDYFRWVGAAAASVIVWEWVERIEAIEREEKKDGILGREIFDGDEMLEVTPSDEVIWSSGRGMARVRRAGGDESDGGGGASGPSALESGLNGLAKRFRKAQQRAPKHFPLGRAHSYHTETATDGSARAGTGNGNVTFGRLPRRNDHLANGITPPPAIASPVSRADTTSAASTEYVVRYDNGADVPQPIRRNVNGDGNSAEAEAKAREQSRRSGERDSEKDDFDEKDEPEPNRDRDAQNKWYAVPNPFKRKRASPPAEVQKARDAAVATGARAATPAHNFPKWDFKHRLGVLAAETGERLRDRSSNRREADNVPVTVVPAAPRGNRQTWSPELVSHSQQQRRGHSNSPYAAGALRTEDEHERSPAEISNATTLTANSMPAAEEAARLSPTRNGPPRADDISPLGAGGAASSSTPTVIRPAPPRRSTQQSLTPRSPPPRADDITPTAGSGGTVVVPAPRRSPLRAMTTSPGEEDSPAARTTSRVELGRENG